MFSVQGKGKFTPDKDTMNTYVWNIIKLKGKNVILNVFITYV